MDYLHKSSRQTVQKHSSRIWTQAILLLTPKSLSPSLKGEGLTEDVYTECTMQAHHWHPVSTNTSVQSSTTDRLGLVCMPSDFLLLDVSALEVIFYNEMRYINLRFTYLLTYTPFLLLAHGSVWGAQVHQDAWQCSLQSTSSVTGIRLSSRFIDSRRITAKENRRILSAAWNDDH